MRLSLFLLAVGFALCCYQCDARGDQVARVLGTCGDRGEAIAPLVRREARRQLLRPGLLAALVVRESRCRAWAIGALGELGLGQLTRQTAAAVGVDPDRLLDPAANLDAAARYLARMILSCNGFVAGGLTRYSRGQSAGCEQSRYSRRVMALAK